MFLSIDQTFVGGPGIASAWKRAELVPEFGVIELIETILLQSRDRLETMPAPRMPILSVRIALLLTLVPFLAVAGRRLPAAPVTASMAPTPHVELTTPEMTFGRVNWDHSSLLYQDLIPPPPSRKLFRGHVKDSIYGHRRLVGSSPPSCQGKCGSCVPCSPIHTSVGSSTGSTAGSLTQQEYYPEVWRCKCGNKLYVP